MNAGQLRALLEGIEDSTEVIIDAPLNCAKSPDLKRHGGNLRLPTHGISVGRFYGNTPHIPSKNWVSIQGTDAWDQLFEIPQGTHYFNLNVQARVLLTEHGAQIYNNHGSRLGPPKKEDHSLEVPLWELAAIFGEHLYNGGEALFRDNTVRLTERD